VRHGYKAGDEVPHLFIREAIEGYLISLDKHGEPVPPGTLDAEVIEIAIG